MKKLFFYSIGILVLASFLLPPMNVALADKAAKEVSLSPMEIVAVVTTTGEYRWVVELASDNESRSVGLMMRKNMPEYHGMLFRFEETRPVSMWMKNTFIPLDMVFTKATGIITHIHRVAVPHSLDIINSNGPVRNVLEMNAGEADKAGLKIGDQLQHPWFVPLD